MGVGRTNDGVGVGPAGVGTGVGVGSAAVADGLSRLAGSGTHAPKATARMATAISPVAR